MKVTEEVVSAMVAAQSPDRRIVVGVDGSDSSKTALRWAVRQAQLAGSAIEAVIAWHVPELTGSYGYRPVSAAGRADLSETAGQTLAAAIAAAVDPATSVPVAQCVVQGNPASVLLKAAAGADLLVVGSRGLGESGSALLGPVSQHCADYAVCPIIIVPGSHWG
jgi:nucleotide-binding universal stress UspA family protein